MPFTNPKIQDDPENSKYFLGFPKGLNTIQDETMIDDKNLSVADNCMLVVDGVTRRYGSYKQFDEASATKTWGQGSFYNRNSGTRRFVRIGASRLQYLNSSSWTNVGATAYSSVKTRFVQANNKLFIHNGTDALTYYDGSTITSYTALSDPSAPTVTPTFTAVANVTSITRSSQTATLTAAAAHGFATGDYVTIAGAVESEYNGTYVITVTSTTVFTYTVSGTPSTPATGTITIRPGGATTYSYKIVAFNSTGNTAASSAGSASTGPVTLTTTAYNKVTWSAVTNATGYDVYGRTSTGFGYVYLATVYTTTYNDTGVDTPTTTLQAPSDNTTGGVKAKMGIFTLGRQFVAGVTEGSTYYPTRLYYSGTVTNIDNFTSGEFGGGWVEIFANDGGEIVDIKPFENGVLVWKTNGLFKFYFTSSGLPALQDITRGHGGVSFEGSQNIDNDYVYVAQKENRIFVATVGTQAQYGENQLRTNEVSIFVSPSLSDVNRAYLSNICSFYYDNKFGFAYTRGSSTENDIGFVLDTQFGGWVRWTGDPVEVTSYHAYDDGTNSKLYGGSATDGYAIELMRTARHDTDVAFTTTVATKFYNGKKYDVEKIFRNPTMWFKYISGGSIDIECWLDGVSFLGSTTLSGDTGGTGAGNDLAGSFLAGGVYNTVTLSEQSADIVAELVFIQLAKSIGFYVIDESSNVNWIFNGFHLYYSELEGKPSASSTRVTLEA